MYGTLITITSPSSASSHMNTQTEEEEDKKYPGLTPRGTLKVGIIVAVTRNKPARPHVLAWIGMERTEHALHLLEPPLGNERGLIGA